MSKVVTLTVENQALVVDSTMLHVSGTTGVYELATSYDEEWEDIDSKIIVFIWSPKDGCPNKRVKIALEDTDGKLAIPHEVLEKPGFLEVGALGLTQDGSIKLTTAPLERGSNVIQIVRAVADSTTSASPTPDIWVTLQNEIGDLSQLKTTTKANLVAAINEVLTSGAITPAEVQRMIDNSVGDATLTVKKNGTTVQTFTANSKTNKVADITVPTKTSDLTNDEGFVKSSALATVATSGAYSDLSGKPTVDTATSTTSTNAVQNKAITTALNTETTNRQNADINLQGQIDGLAASSDVTDIVGTKAALNAYDTSKLHDNDIIKVLQDESENDATTYYRWSTTTQTFTLIGEEGPYYTKAQTDTLLGGKQGSLPPGTNITISNDNTISAAGYTLPTASANDLGGIKVGTNLSIDSGGVLSATDTTYSNFVGTDGQTAGVAGLVPAPATTDDGKFLKADGTWDTAGGSSMPLYTGLGANTDGPMTQKAVTDALFNDSATAKQIKIGYNTQSDQTDTVAIGGSAKAHGINAVAIGGSAQAGGTGQFYCTAIGHGAKAIDTGNVAIGDGATATAQPRSIALGSYAIATRKGELNIGLGNNSVGFNSSKYRVIGGVYDGQTDHDAATVGQLNAKAVGTTVSAVIATSAWTALSDAGPYTYSATITPQVTFTDNAIITLLNDNPVLFAIFGFVIEQADSINQELTIWSIGLPEETVGFNINFKEA